MMNIVTLNSTNNVIIYILITKSWKTLCVAVVVLYNMIW